MLRPGLVTYRPMAPKSAIIAACLMTALVATSMPVAAQAPVPVPLPLEVLDGVVSVVSQLTSLDALNSGQSVNAYCGGDGSGYDFCRGYVDNKFSAHKYTVYYCTASCSTPTDGTIDLGFASGSWCVYADDGVVITTCDATFSGSADNVIGGTIYGGSGNHDIIGGWAVEATGA